MTSNISNSGANKRRNLKIVLPKREQVSSESFQMSLQGSIADYYKTTARSSSRKFQNHIADVLYDFSGELYMQRDNGIARLANLPDVHDVLGEDARWLRCFLTRHRPRRELFKLVLLSAFLAIEKPETYAQLVTF